VMLKPTALVHAVFLFGWLLISRHEPEGHGDGWKSAGSFSAGLFAGVLIWIAYFAVKGALYHLWEVLVLFNSFHAATPEARGDSIRGLIIGGYWFVFYIIPLLILLLPLPVKGWRLGRAKAFILGWFLMSLLQVALQGKFFMYHWIILIPATGLAAGAGLDAAFDAASRYLGGWPARAAAALVLGWLTFIYGGYWYLISESYKTRDYLQKRITRSEYYARFNSSDAGGKGDFNLLASAVAASYAWERVPRDGRLLVFGYEPVVNFLAGRPAPTRFEIDYPLTFTPRSERARKFREKWRAEFMEDLRKNPPEMVALVDDDENPIEPLPSIIQAEQFEEFWFWLNENYDKDAVIEDFHFYRIKKRARSP